MIVGEDAVRGARFVADDWLSERLGKPAYHLAGQPGDLDAEQWALTSSGPVFIDAKIPVDDIAGADILARRGFRLVDSLLTFDASLERLKLASVAAGAGVEVGFADPAEAGAVADIAGVAFQMDRFNRDPMIAPEAACRMKRDWAGNFFRGQRGRWMVVARDGGRVTGFLQLLHVNGDQMIVDLIAVAASHMGQGLGKAMFAFAARHCTDVATVLVGTQAANIPAARLYESLGFRLTRIQYVFHFHGQ